MTTQGETSANVSVSASTESPASQDRKKFGLNALRMPFLGSPKKATPVKSSTSTGDAAFSSSEQAATETTDPSQVLSGDVNGVGETAQIAEPDSNPTELAKEAVGRAPCPPQLLLKPVRSAMAQTGAPDKAARSPSPHRVSFSPSIEQVEEARELAKLNTAREAAFRQSAQTKERSRPKSLGVKWPALRKSHSTSDLLDMQGRASLESASSVSSSTASSSTHESSTGKVEAPKVASAKRKLFRWDKRGIHQMGASQTQDKGKVAKVKVTKHQVTAARHAKTLEQVINAGMGLHPAPPRQSSAPAQPAPSESSGKKGKQKLKARPVPMAEASQLKGLKSALLDADMANGIIDRLRSMPVPLDSLHKGIGRLEPENRIGTAGDHGDERVLTANLPDSILEDPTSKDDSEIRKRTGATADTLSSANAQLSPPPMNRSKSAAEEALRKYAASPDNVQKNPAKVTARTSSLPASEPPATSSSAPTSAPATPAAPPTSEVKPVFASRPLKLVHLDCGEDAAHRRHFEHVDRSNATVTESADDTGPSSSSTAGKIAAGAAAAIAGVGGFLSSRAPSSPVGEMTMQSASVESPGMVRSLSAAALPTLQGGAQLMGSSPLQLLMDPVGTAAQTSGAFEALAEVSGAAIHATQDMSAFHPPLDRMAIFVHWWGFEITLPSATLLYLNTAHSVSGAFLSFLQTMAVGGGVPELLPFIKYISTFMEVEYKAIQAQDEGHGVVVAATWFMPLALVPRAWDYPLDGPQTSNEVPPEAMIPNLPASGKSAPPQASTQAQSAPKKKHSSKKVAAV